MSSFDSSVDPLATPPVETSTSWSESAEQNNQVVHPIVHSYPERHQLQALHHHQYQAHHHAGTIINESEHEDRSDAAEHGDVDGDEHEFDDDQHDEVDDQDDEEEDSHFDEYSRSRFSRHPDAADEEEEYEPSHIMQESAVSPPISSFAALSINTPVEQEQQMQQTQFTESSSSSSSITSTAATQVAQQLQHASHSAAARVIVHPTSEQILKDLSDFVCPICSQLAWDPVQTPCAHVFCRSCILEWLHPSGGATQQRRVCPLDRIPIDSTTLQPIKSKNPLAYKILGRVEIACVKHAALGCTWLGEYSGAEEHLTRGCPFTLVSCTHCSERFQRRHIQVHEQESCAHRPVPCRFCEISLPRELLEQHVREVCVEAPVQCDGTEQGGMCKEQEDGEYKQQAHDRGASFLEEKEGGCGLILPRAAYASHRSTSCLAARVQCPFAVHGCTGSTLSSSVDHVTRGGHTGGGLARADLESHMADAARDHVMILSASLVAERQRRKELESHMFQFLQAFTEYVSHSEPPQHEPKSVHTRGGMARNTLMQAAMKWSEILVSQFHETPVTATSTPHPMQPSRPSTMQSIAPPTMPASSPSSSSSYSLRSTCDLSMLSEEELTQALVHLPAPLSTLLPSGNGSSSPLPIDPRLLPFSIGMHLDVRDSKGKWLEAEIIASRSSNRPTTGVTASASSFDTAMSSYPDCIQVHYLNWSERWDEWLDCRKEPGRVAPFHTFSTPSVATSSSSTPAPNGRTNASSSNASSPPLTNPYKLHSDVLVYYFCPRPRAWARGVVWKVDGLQVSVRYTAQGSVFQRWFWSRSDEIRPLGSELTRYSGSNNTSASAVNSMSSSGGISSANSSTIRAAPRSPTIHEPPFSLPMDWSHRSSHPLRPASSSNAPSIAHVPLPQRLLQATSPSQQRRRPMPDVYHDRPSNSQRVPFDDLRG